MLQYSKTYRKYGQSVYSCQYIVAFCTKYKRNIFKEKDLKTLETSFKETAKKYNFIIHNIKLHKNLVIIAIEISNPEFTIENAITKLKKDSRNALINSDQTFKSRIPSIWTKEEFVTTIGTYSEDELNKFVELQDNYTESITKYK